MSSKTKQQIEDENKLPPKLEENKEIIKELKAKNVDFMYNETLLQESQEKRDKVIETMIELQRIEPGLITVFGDQDHTFGSDYSEENIAQLKATAEFDKKMAEMVFGKDANDIDIKVKIECTERDLYLDLFIFIKVIIGILTFLFLCLFNLL